VEDIADIIITKSKRTKTYLSQPLRSIDFIVANEAIDKLVSEGGEGFYNYVDSIGLSKDPNLIVLSSLHNYYYDSEEMNNVKTVINLKELNGINQIKSLLHTHLHSLPQKCNFVGCFIDNKKIARFALKNSSTSGKRIKNSDAVELGIVSRFPFINMLYSVMDLKTNTYMSERSVTLMLGVHGFKVMDMTEFNGLTFFHSRKVGMTYN
jgi:hypothetical protein